jgi:hypothetical protein
LALPQAATWATADPAGDRNVHKGRPEDRHPLKEHDA